MSKQKQNIQLPLRNLLFHAIIENEIRQSPFGQQTYNAVLRNGEVVIESVNVVKQRRIKYKLDKGTK